MKYILRLKLQNWDLSSEEDSSKESSVFLFLNEFHHQKICQTILNYWPLLASTLLMLNTTLHTCSYLHSYNKYNKTFYFYFVSMQELCA